MRETQIAERLDGLLDGVFERNEIRSAVMSVVSGDGAFRWAGARGAVSPDGAAMTPTTPWFIASITKLFIASTVLRMVEEGELTLEDRVVDRLPAAVTDRLHVLDGKDRTHWITVEHLLCHASGLADFIEDYPAKRRGEARDCRSLVEILVEDGDRAWPLEDMARRVRERLAPHFPPQSLDAQRVRIRYSDTNYQLLVGIIEARRDAPFFQVLEGLILNPLGLKDTWVPGRSRVSGRESGVAALYAGTEVVRLPSFLSSISDMNSTCDDLVRFFKGVNGGGLFRDPGTWLRMQARWRRFSFPLDRAALRQPSWPIEYGLGVMRFRLPRFLAPFRPVPQVVGHTGSTGTWLFHAPEPDLYLAGAVNQVTAGAVPFKLVPRVLRAVTDG
ncbi:MAG: serine hydrolase domain-containing protein [Acidobacteriota bacterium]|nr:serine hydrolase domain-containing protein [Acidobacteriota bacterium]